MMETNFGLIGKSLSHSFSAKYFENKFQQLQLPNFSYKLFPLVSIYDLLPLLKLNNYLKGLNVTIPYKQEVLPFLDELSATAKQVGAVNTIKIEFLNNQLYLKGYNTDVYGFFQLLKLFNLSQVSSALILGTGGASLSVAYVLNYLKIPFIKVSRLSKYNCITYSELTQSIIENNTLIINTSPLGTFPNISDYPNIPYEFLSSNHIVIDLIYNPAKTLFLEKAESHKAKIANGNEMLVNQAEASWNIWMNKGTDDI